MLAEDGPVPAALANKPEVEDGLDWYLAAFWDLTHDRQMGAMGGAGGIPWTAIDRYADRHEIDDFDQFKTVIKALDGVYLEHVGEKMKALPEKKAKAPRKRG